MGPAEESLGRKATAGFPRSLTTGHSGVALGVLFVVSLFNYVDRSLLSILQVPIKQELGLSDAQLGALTGLSFALFYATAALPLARLVDRYRRIWLMAAALTVWTAMTALSGFATSFAVLVVCRIGVALGEAGSVPATHSLLSDYFPLKRRGSAFALWALASPAGMMLGVFLGGWLSEDLGWRRAFMAIGIAGLFLVPVLLLVREPARGRFEGAADGFEFKPPPFGQALGALASLRSFRLLVLGATLQTFAYMSFLNWCPPFLSRVHHLPLSEVALWSALIIGLGGGSGAFAGGVIVDLLARRDVRWYGWAPAISILLSVPFAVTQLLTPSVEASISLGFLTAFLAGSYVAPVNVTAQSMVSPAVRGLTSAILLLVPTIFGLGLGPFLTGLASDTLAARYGLGDQALRYAITLAFLPSIAAGACLIAMARSIGADLFKPVPQVP
jgi:predicted MFS family arabinose efflux permease